MTLLLALRLIQNRHREATYCTTPAAGSMLFSICTAIGAVQNAVLIHLNCNYEINWVVVVY